MKGHSRIFRALVLAGLLAGGLRPVAAGPTDTITLPGGLAPADRQHLESELSRLQDRVAALPSPGSAADPASAADRRADAELFLKGVEWALRYETAAATPDDVRLLATWLTRAEERLAALRAGEAPWVTKKGRVLRGFVSAIDGSVQSYGVIVPAGYDGTKPMRLDVILHGSSKPVGLSEIRILARYDDGDTGGATASLENYIEIYPLGRVENGYRWAGETDVFEAIEAACRSYRIDRDRIVLRGFSMGASGTWHLGLKHPDYFAAIGPYAGYVDTHTLSMIQGIAPTWVKVGPLPPHQEKALHLLDSVDYAANIGIVPTVAAIGALDPGFQTHVTMNEAVAREGLQLTNLISPFAGHTRDPVTLREQLRQINGYVTPGLNHAPRDLRFVTWTLKYNRAHWIEILALHEHYARTEIRASSRADGSVEISTHQNVASFALGPPMLQDFTATLRIDGAVVALPEIRYRDRHRTLVFGEKDGHWVCLGLRGEVVLTGKRPGLQGPIDDAFTAPFLCVRGTGPAWNPAVAAWSEASLRRFAYEWNRYLRGELPVKDDTAVTAEDIRTKHLILFGDPGSNSLIRQALPSLPLAWTKSELRMAGRAYSAVDHAPAFITASPLPGAGDHYLVINSGHTFHERELASLNYLLFPRLGDWAVMKITADAASWQPGGGEFPEAPEQAGFFDEAWDHPAAAGP
ncbi:MAG TPA: prolyl oligopeptidase family serine peptidase [Lacunisphaera sp.]|nr:prolyl oligopeptidase family serine peptidase [Lacunisphaera sp.]